MTYSIIKCVNGNYNIHAEGISTVESAKVQFHQLCAVLWNAPDVERATVMISHEELDAVENYREFIHHETEQTNVSE